MNEEDKKWVDDLLKDITKQHRDDHARNIMIERIFRLYGRYGDEVIKDLLKRMKNYRKR